ncbi:MAG: hypothetical protein M3321_05495 [Actinomycetota bacterium]|nr:hypothetical protein [Actinomycetota bacterium]
MRLVEQWRAIERDLPEDWGDARLVMTVGDERQANRAAGLLGPITPGRRGKQLRFYTARRGAGHRPDLVRRLLARLDAERIEGELELVSSGAPEQAAPAEIVRPTLTAMWDAAVAALPSDWSDAYAEVELRSSDHLDRAALLLSPVNPARFGGRPGFRFRTARVFGYGVSPEMARRCFERLDSEGIRGSVRILRALSDTHPVQTQGPVWYVGGKAV